MPEYKYTQPRWVAHKWDAKGLEDHRPGLVRRKSVIDSKSIAYKAACSCGWRGDNFTSMGAAGRQWDQHVADKEGDGIQGEFF